MYIKECRLGFFSVKLQGTTKEARKSTVGDLEQSDEGGFSFSTFVLELLLYFSCNHVLISSLRVFDVNYVTFVNSYDFQCMNLFVYEFVQLILRSCSCVLHINMIYKPFMRLKSEC